MNPNTPGQKKNQQIPNTQIPSPPEHNHPIE